jgi:hypothetical protein
MDANRNRGARYGTQNLIISVFVAFVLIVINVFSILAFKFGVLEVLVLSVLSLILYLGLILFLRSYSGRAIKRISKGAFESADRIGEKPLNKPVAMYIPSDDDKALAEDIMREIRGSVSESIEIPHYDYVGSSKTKKYHVKSCRLAKGIDPKFKLMNNNPLFFKKRKFKPCRLCLKKQKKR